MFRRRWSGLPDDPEFPADLKELGYFVNEDDEIRSIKDPKFYFNYFINKSMRHNDRQRFAFNLAVQDLIHTRLASPPLNLTKLALPLGTPTTSPHTPIFVSSDLHLKKRVVVLFGEHDQDLGVFAHRVIGGRGGVDAGSAVGFVKAFLLQGGEDVGFVLANTGENCWWPEGQRALSYRQSDGVRMKSAVHRGRYFDPSVNGIPGNGSVDEHVRTVFDSVLGNVEFVDKEARIEVIGAGEGAVSVEQFLDENWAAWKDRIVSLAILGAGMEQSQVKNEGFRVFLKERARAYITCSTPLDTPMANPGGNPYAHYNTTLGCPVLSSGEDSYSELTLIKAQPAVLAWMGEVYTAVRDGRSYKNPALEVTFRSEEFEESLEFRDRPESEGWTKYVGPPPNVSALKDEEESEEGAKSEQGDAKAETTELEVAEGSSEGRTNPVGPPPKVSCLKDEGESDKGAKIEQGDTKAEKAEVDVAEGSPKTSLSPTETLASITSDGAELELDRDKVNDEFNLALDTYYDVYQELATSDQSLEEAEVRQYEEIRAWVEQARDKDEANTEKMKAQLREEELMFDDLEKHEADESRKALLKELMATRREGKAAMRDATTEVKDMTKLIESLIKPLEERLTGEHNEATVERPQAGEEPAPASNEQAETTATSAVANDDPEPLKTEHKPECKDEDQKNQVDGAESSEGGVGLGSWGSVVRQAYASLIGGKENDGGSKKDGAVSKDGKEKLAGNVAEETEEEKAFV